ncbi:hypothetical protein EBS02_12620, partial [bacterium]|nr:hypothetical protein [bacterium]
MDNGDRYFALAHIYMQNENYKRTFLKIRNRSPKAFICLDNGCAEHSLVTEEILLKIVAELKPDEVIAPDVLFDKDKTLANFSSFIGKMLERSLMSHTSIFACPQGSTKEEWLQCYTKMVMNPFVKCIGL